MSAQSGETFTWHFPNQESLIADQRSITGVDGINSHLYSALIHATELVSRESDAHCAIGGAYELPASLYSKPSSSLAPSLALSGPFDSQMNQPGRTLSMIHHAFRCQLCTTQESTEYYFAQSDSIWGRLISQPLPPGVYRSEELVDETRLPMDQWHHAGFETPITTHAMSWAGCIVLDLPEQAWAIILAMGHEESRVGPHRIRSLLSQLEQPLTHKLSQAMSLDNHQGRNASHKPNTVDMLRKLSKTERSVLEHLLEANRTEREVANTLHRSPHTIHVHVKSIYRKLNVSSRRELIDTMRYVMTPTV